MSESQESIPNIAISGWSGVGSTTLTLILTTLLKKKYYPITKIFRHINAKLGYAKHTVMSKEFEEMIQPMIGKTVDNFVDFKLLRSNNIILESDIASFRLGKHPKIYSIFIKADTKTRLARMAKDERGNEAPLDERDAAHKAEYVKLWDIDMFDEELIDRKYNLVVDNTELPLLNEIELVIGFLSAHQVFKDAHDWDKVKQDIPKVIKEYKELKSKGMLEKLAKKGLVASVPDMMKEIVKAFPEDVTTYPENLQKIFLGQD